MNSTPWRNILTDRGCSRTVHISVLDHLGHHTERYIVDIDAGLWRPKGDFAEFALLVDEYSFSIAISVKFANRQKIDLMQGTGHSNLDMNCFGQEIQQILFLPTENRIHDVQFSAPNKLILGGYTVACHLAKERIGEVEWQAAEVYADGSIRFSDPIPVTI